MNNVRILTIESDFGAGIKGAKLGPAKLISLLKKTNHYLGKLPVNTVSSDNIDDGNKFTNAKNIDSILSVQKESLDVIQSYLKNNEFPLVISGDHSNGASLISAVKDYYPDKTIGVIWIDAHADLHSPFTTPSGNVHGMPLAACLGADNLENGHNKPAKKEVDLWQKLEKLGSKKITPKILPQNIVFIDLRDFEAEELQLIEKLNIKHFTPEHRQQFGIEEIANKTLAHLANCDLIILSFDVDSLDPVISHGTGTPVVNGLQLNEAIILLKQFLSNPKIAAFEITEINPLLDRTNPMEEVACTILTSIF